MAYDKCELSSSFELLNDLKSRHKDQTKRESRSYLPPTELLVEQYWFAHSSSAHKFTDFVFSYVVVAVSLLSVVNILTISTINITTRDSSGAGLSRSTTSLHISLRMFYFKFLFAKEANLPIQRPNACVPAVSCRVFSRSVMLRLCCVSSFTICHALFLYTLRNPLLVKMMQMNVNTFTFIFTQMSASVLNFV